MAFVDLHWRVDPREDILGHSECAVMEAFARRAGWRTAAVVMSDGDSDDEKYDKRSAGGGGGADADDRRTMPTAAAKRQAQTGMRNAKRARLNAQHTTMNARASGKSDTAATDGTASSRMSLLRRVDVPLDANGGSMTTSGSGRAGSTGAGAGADIVAVVPSSEKALLAVASGAVACDIVRLILARPLSFHLRPAVLERIRARGVFFEICYADALRGATARRHLFTNAKALVAAARGGRSIVLSSGAKTANELRSPHDVANLATLFGIKEDQARRAVGDNVRECLQRAKLRLAKTAAR